VPADSEPLALAVAAGACCEWIIAGVPGQVRSGRCSGRAARFCSVARGGGRCSRGLPAGRCGWLSWRKKKPGCWVTTTSAPSTCCSASSTRATAWRPGRWSRWGISLVAVRQLVEEIIGPGDQVPSEGIPFTPRAKKVLELALRESLQLGHDSIGTEHILLGLILEGDSVAAQVLVKLGAEMNRVRQRVIELTFSQCPQPGRQPPRDGAPVPEVQARLDAVEGRPAAGQHGWQQRAAIGSVFGRWAEIVGPDLAAHTKPDSFTDGELAVTADSTAWATQARVLAPQLVRRLRRAPLRPGLTSYGRVTYSSRRLWQVWSVPPAPHSCLAATGAPARGDWRCCPSAW
jgi:hypothetical protein